MLRFFRQIRQRLLTQNRFSKYLLYAIGEILLVVIGILIALQINNWNEAQNLEQRKAQYISSLIDDLKKDTVQLHSEINLIESDLATLKNFRRRLSAPGATLDTALHIARFEFLPFFDPSNELNRNTISSLLSTGDIRLFSDSVRNRILQHNMDQVKWLKVMDQNVSIFFSGYNRLPPSEHKEVDSIVIRGKLLDDIWDSKNKMDILIALSDVMNSKSTMQLFILQSKRYILSRTEELLDYLVRI